MGFEPWSERFPYRSLYYLSGQPERIGGRCLLDVVERLFDGVEVEHHAPRRAGALQCARRIVDRVGPNGHELLLELDRLAGFPLHPAASVALSADDAQEVT